MVANFAPRFYRVAVFAPPQGLLAAQQGCRLRYDLRQLRPGCEVAPRFVLRGAYRRPEIGRSSVILEIRAAMCAQLLVICSGRLINGIGKALDPKVCPACQQQRFGLYV